MQFCIFEDRQVENLFPLVAPRPVYDLRCGAFPLSHKLFRRFPRATCSLHVRAYLRDVVREENPGTHVNEMPDADIWLINGRVIANDELSSFLRTKTGTRSMLMQGNELVAAYVDRAGVKECTAEFNGAYFDPDRFAGYDVTSFNGSLVHYPWDLVDAASTEIEKDFASLRPARKISVRIAPGVHLLERKNIIIGKGSEVKPGVVLDATHGPIIIGTNVTIMPNAVVMGPACIGDNSVIRIGAKIYHGTSIGPWCKVGGEVEESVLQSFANKQHDGFLGHSYLGSWVNLGADTNTSDLKNTYGNVQVRIAGNMVDTGRQFVGLTMGDHSKTGINVMFDTGTVVGFSANLYGAGLPPKSVPSFSWGDAGDLQEYELEKSISTARKVMKRRNVEMSGAYELMMRKLFAATGPERGNAGGRT